MWGYSGVRSFWDLNGDRRHRRLVFDLVEDADGGGVAEGGLGLVLVGADELLGENASQEQGEVFHVRPRC